MNQVSTKKMKPVCPSHDRLVFEYYTPSLIHNEGFSKIDHRKQRGVSDVIAVLLLLGITVAGAVLVSAFFSGNNAFRFDTNNQGTQTSYLKIIGYDTRDGFKLSNVTSLNNTKQFDATPSICTSSCSTFPDNLPTAGLALNGTEFIVLNVRNDGPTSATIQSVVINDGFRDRDHAWDTNTKGLNLLNTANIPKAGKFSIIESTNKTPQTQRSTNEITKNDEVRLVIKLSKDISGNFDANQPIRIRLITNLIDPPETTITAGSVR